jgi:hypothetical protein
MNLRIEISAREYCSGMESRDMTSVVVLTEDLSCDETSNFDFILYPRFWDVSLVCVRTSVPVVPRNARHCVDKVTLHSIAVFWIYQVI